MGQTSETGKRLEVAFQKQILGDEISFRNRLWQSEPEAECGADGKESGEGTRESQGLVPPKAAVSQGPQLSI